MKAHVAGIAAGEHECRNALALPPVRHARTECFDHAGDVPAGNKRWPGIAAGVTAGPHQYVGVCHPGCEYSHPDLAGTRVWHFVGADPHHVGVAETLDDDSTPVAHDRLRSWVLMSTPAMTTAAMALARLAGPSRPSTANDETDVIRTPAVRPKLKIITGTACLAGRDAATSNRTHKIRSGTRNRLSRRQELFRNRKRNVPALNATAATRLAATVFMEDLLVDCDVYSVDKVVTGCLRRRHSQAIRQDGAHVQVEALDTLSHRRCGAAGR
jgi:hypothetical protein